MFNKYSNGSVGRYKTHAGQNCYTIVKRLKFQEAITSFEVQTDGARLERAGRHPSLKRGSLIQVPSTNPIFTCERHVQIITTRIFYHLIWDKTTSGKPEWSDMTYWRILIKCYTLGYGKILHLANQHKFRVCCSVNTRRHPPRWLAKVIQTKVTLRNEGRPQPRTQWINILHKGSTNPSNTVNLCMRWGENLRSIRSLSDEFSPM
jgi:hypothetical protein